MVRKYKKRTYKPRKRTYRRRYYKRRYYRRRYKPIKKPEIHIVEKSTPLTQVQSQILPPAFNDTTYGMGKIVNFTEITANNDADVDKLVYNVSGKEIEGRKIRLKYLYIKGYVSLDNDANDVNIKLMMFRWKRNTINSQLLWGNLINNTNNIDLSDSTNWTRQQQLDLLYAQDWKNDIKVNFYKKVKNLYRKYDNANNIIPFKMRIPLYDCVLTCDSYKNITDNNFYAHAHPSTNGLYFTFLSDNNWSPSSRIYYKYKLYYTDY